jgi:hypothetical protein
VLGGPSHWFWSCTWFVVLSLEGRSLMKWGPRIEVAELTKPLLPNYHFIKCLFSHSQAISTPWCGTTASVLEDSIFEHVQENKWCCIWFHKWEMIQCLDMDQSMSHIHWWHVWRSAYLLPFIIHSFNVFFPLAYTVKKYQSHKTVLCKVVTLFMDCEYCQETTDRTTSEINIIPRTP